MVKNMGFLDRTIRVGIAVIIGFFYVTGCVSGFAAFFFGLLAIVFIFTSFAHHCPLYVPLRWNTSK